MSSELKTKDSNPELFIYMVNTTKAVASFSVTQTFLAVLDHTLGPSEGPLYMSCTQIHRNVFSRDQTTPSASKVRGRGRRILFAGLFLKQQLFHSIHPKHPFLPTHKLKHWAGLP